MLSQEGAFNWSIVLNVSFAEGLCSRILVIRYFNQLLKTEGLMSFIKIRLIINVVFRFFLSFFIM